MIFTLLFACAPEPTGPEPTGVDLTGTWEALPAPVLEGRFPEFGTAGDPTVVPTAGGYLMLYTDYAEELGGADIWSATSTDGITWEIGDRALFGAAGAWDGAHETPHLVDADTLYALGYPDPVAGFVSGADVGRWTRTGAGWTPDPEGPVLTRTPGGPDADAITSPTVVADPAGGWFMAWTGWCFTCIPVVSLLGATSDDGIHWTKLDEPLITDTGLAWADAGLAETQLVHDGGGWWLLFSSVDADLVHRVGVARAPSPAGPWTLHPSPILTPAGLGDWAGGGVLAPHLVLEEWRATLWFSELDVSGSGFRIGRAIPAP